MFYISYSRFFTLSILQSFTLFFLGHKNQGVVTAALRLYKHALLGCETFSGRFIHNGGWRE